MRQLATAWDGVAYEVKQDSLVIMEDEREVYAGNELARMADLRRFAEERSMERWRRAGGQHGYRLLRWKTYP